MSKRSSIQARGLLVVAIATALEFLAASNTHAQSERAQDFEASYLGAQAAGVAIKRPLPGPWSCGGGDVDFGTGDRDCGSMTGGPSGGNSNRN